MGLGTDAGVEIGGLNFLAHSILGKSLVDVDHEASFDRKPTAAGVAIAGSGCNDED
jgi:hypothetical protein